MIMTLSSNPQIHHLSNFVFTVLSYIVQSKTVVSISKYIEVCNEILFYCKLQMFSTSEAAVH